MPSLLPHSPQVPLQGPASQPRTQFPLSLSLSLSLSLTHTHTHQKEAEHRIHRVTPCSSSRKQVPPVLCPEQETGLEDECTLPSIHCSGHRSHSLVQPVQTAETSLPPYQKGKNKRTQLFWPRCPAPFSCHHLIFKCGEFPHWRIK